MIQVKSNIYFRLRNRAIYPTSAIRSARKRRLPEMIEGDDDEGDSSAIRSISGQARNKKRGSTTLIDAVSILASARSAGEERKFDFLSEHLQQQGELRRRELDLERERLNIEREKNEMEQRKTQLMMKQLETSLQIGRKRAEVSDSESKRQAIIIDDEKEVKNDLFNIKDL